MRQHAAEPWRAYSRGRLIRPELSGMIMINKCSDIRVQGKLHFPKIVIITMIIGLD